MEKKGTRRDKGRVGDEKICLLGADCKRTLHSARRKRTNQNGNQIENEAALSRGLGVALHINLCQSKVGKGR